MKTTRIEENTREVEEMATGFERFDSFFAGLGMKKEKNCIKHYEDYLAGYIRTALHQQLQKAHQQLQKAREEESERLYKEFEKETDGWKRPVPMETAKGILTNWSEYKVVDHSELDKRLVNKIKIV